MPKTVDAQVLLQDLERLNKRLSEIALRDFTPLTVPQLNWQEAAHKWSILECIAHLNYVADFYFPPTLKALEYAKKKGSRPQKTFTRGWLGHIYVSKMRLNQNNQFKKSIEAPQKYVPVLDNNEQLDKKEVFDKFVVNQKTLTRILMEAKTINIEKTRVYAAVFNLVSIRLGDMLKILVYHDERHIVQAQRVLYHDHFLGNVPLDTLLSAQSQSLSPDS
ncbi:MAG: DinB family protein [Aureispira sp.]